MTTLLQSVSTPDPRISKAALAGRNHPGVRRRAARWLALAVGCTAVLAWTASLRVPSGPAEGTALNGLEATQSCVTTTTARETFRVATFNIHGGRGIDGVRNLDRTAECLVGCDLIALNEVRGRYFWQAADQAEILGDTLDMPWLFAPAECRWWHFDFGSALLTRLPVSHWQRIPLARTGGNTHRNLLLAAADFNGRKINIVITHLDSRDPERRQSQMRAVSDLFLSLSAPALLLGDLNASADDPQIQRVLSMPGVVDALANAPGDDAMERIDWILARGLHPKCAGICVKGASDHSCYWADLELSPAARAY
jgi:endonuclease/exonuclease/phosphatase family metal-dependent hydrolase